MDMRGCTVVCLRSHHRRPQRWPCAVRASVDDSGTSAPSARRLHRPRPVAPAPHSRGVSRWSRPCIGAVSTARGPSHHAGNVAHILWYGVPNPGGAPVPPLVLSYHHPRRRPGFVYFLYCTLGRVRKYFMFPRPVSGGAPAYSW